MASKQKMYVFGVDVYCCRKVRTIKFAVKASSRSQADLIISRAFGEVIAYNAVYFGCDEFVSTDELFKSFHFEINVAYRCKSRYVKIIVEANNLEQANNILYGTFGEFVGYHTKYRGNR